MQKPRKIK